MELALRDQQAAFVRAYLSGKTADAAAKEAGYYGTSAGSRLLTIPAVAHAIHAELSRLFTTQAAPLAFQVGMRFLRSNDPKLARIQADVAIKFLQMAGHGVQVANPDDSRSLSEMSPDELRAFIDRNQAEIDRLEQELAGRAKDVSAPIPSQVEAKPLTYLD